LLKQQATWKCLGITTSHETEQHTPLVDLNYSWQLVPFLKQEHARQVGSFKRHFWGDKMTKIIETTTWRPIRDDLSN